jgi:serine/threonine protein kinase
MSIDVLTCATCGIDYPIRHLDQTMTLRCPRCGGMLLAPRARPAVQLPAVNPVVPESDRAFGPFRLLRRIGRGGMGVVYEALNTAAGGRRVAVKTFELNDPAEDGPRVLREARACAKLPAHPNVVALYDAHRVGSAIALEMEFVDGLPLHEWRRQGPPTLPRQIAALRDVALALEHIHAHGIIHRDIKPENVLVGKDGRPKLSDFGLAKITDGGIEQTSTVTGAIVGTPTYMSPEQALKPKNADARSDIFSLGVTLYETLAGLLPFTGRSTVALIMSIINDVPPPPSKVTSVWPDGAVDAELDALCAKALAKKPEERFPSARAFADALGAWLAKRA